MAESFEALWLQTYPDPEKKMERLKNLGIIRHFFNNIDFL